MQLKVGDHVEHLDGAYMGEVKALGKSGALLVAPPSGASWRWIPSAELTIKVTPPAPLSLSCGEVGYVQCDECDKYSMCIGMSRGAYAESTPVICEDCLKGCLVLLQTEKEKSNNAAS